jgi:branched-chain amino acid transport system permease protein
MTFRSSQKGIAEMDGELRKVGTSALKHTLFIAVPLLVIFAVLPGVYQNHLLLFNFVIFLILAQGVNIIYGFTGYLPFGYVGFFGAGAYGFAVLVMHFQTPALPAVLVAGLVGVALGLLLTPLLRLSGAYFAIANLAASLAVLHLIANPALESITRGPYGVSLSGTFNPTLAYSAALAVLALTLGVVVFLKNSRFGLALQAVREDAVSASMAGVNVVRMRVIAWLASALVAGLAGGVYAWYVSVFYPDNVFSGEFSIFAIVFALFGGVASISGPIVGVIILYGIYNLIGFTAPQYFQLIYGLLIMGLVLFLPAGLVSLATRRGWHVP